MSDFNQLQQSLRIEGDREASVSFKAIDYEELKNLLKDSSVEDLLVEINKHTKLIETATELAANSSDLSKNLRPLLSMYLLQLSIILGNLCSFYDRKVNIIGKYTGVDLTYNQ